MNTTTPSVTHRPIHGVPSATGSCDVSNPAATALGWPNPLASTARSFTRSPAGVLTSIFVSHMSSVGSHFMPRSDRRSVSSEADAGSLTSWISPR